MNWALYGQKDEGQSLLFFQCGECDLILKDPVIRLSLDEESKRYDLHNNSFEDSNYRKFLSLLMQPIAKKVKPGARGLDFGCGPEPAMAKLFQAEGLSCVSYDPIFQSDPKLLESKYDFISCSEVAEHFYSPAKEFSLLFGLLKSGGWLGIKTEKPGKDFASWWYHKDPTHVTFYSEKTFQWIAKHFNAVLELHESQVVLFQKAFT